ncbi:Chanoclavine-I aldehyde reductase fgaOx3 [Exophiala dermatitidis]
MISPRAISSRNVPGLWSESQRAAWKEIADSIHAKGCLFACQLWHQGRAGNPEVLQAEGSKLWSSSATPVTPDGPTPIAMPEEEIWRTIGDYATAAKNAIAAGFDLVEIHGANGYLPDQFLFLFEVTKAVVTAIGADRVGVRLSPYSDFLGMLMEDPDPTFKRMVERLKPLGLAYLHLIEARIRGNDDADCGGQRTVKWLVELWDNVSPVLLSGGFNAESAKTAVDETYAQYDVCIVFGRYFVANPDLVFRIKSGVPLTKYERAYFYTPKLVEGYTDYPFSKEYLAQVQVQAAL